MVELAEGFAAGADSGGMLVVEAATGVIAEKALREWAANWPSEKARLTPLFAVRSRLLLPPPFSRHFI